MDISQFKAQVVLEAFFLVDGQPLKKEVCVFGYDLSSEDVIKCLEKECDDIGFQVELENDKQVVVTYTKAVVKKSILSSFLPVGKEIFNRIIN